MGVLFARARDFSVSFLGAQAVSLRIDTIASPAPVCAHTYTYTYTDTETTATGRVYRENPEPRDK